MNICEYGCEQEAKYQFGNGKWCCHKSWNSCPTKKNLLRDCQLGRKQTKEHRKNNSISHTGKKHSENHKQSISKSNTGKKRSLEFRENLSLIHKGKVVSEKSRKRMSNSKKLRLL